MELVEIVFRMTTRGYIVQAVTKTTLINYGALGSETVPPRALSSVTQSCRLPSRRHFEIAPLGTTLRGMFGEHQ